MVDLMELQKAVYQNKLDKNFNVTDVSKEFCYTFGELSEAFEAYSKKKADLGEELADVALYLLGLAEILGVNLEAEILRKLEINKARRYAQIDGVNIRLEQEI